MAAMDRFERRAPSLSIYNNFNEFVSLNAHCQNPISDSCVLVSLRTQFVNVPCRRQVLQVLSRRDADSGSNAWLPQCKDYLQASASDLLTLLPHPSCTAFRGLGGALRVDKADIGQPSCTREVAGAIHCHHRRCHFIAYAAACDVLEICRALHWLRSFNGTSLSRQSIFWTRLPRSCA